MESRPKVGEVVTHLEKAVTDWGGGLTPPSFPAANVAVDSGEPLSDSEEQSEFCILILLGIIR